MTTARTHIDELPILMTSPAPPRGFAELYEQHYEAVFRAALRVTGNQALIYQQKDLETQWDLWALPLAGSRQSMAILRGASNEQQGRLSPDGGWIAYTSDESGRFELYIRQFPPTDASWKVSVDGGTQPEWRRDGKELFYVSGDRRLLAVPLQGGDSLRLGSPKPLFAIDTEGVMTTPGSFHYSASADGQRFVVNTVISRGTPTMTVVLNSTAALHE